jgi:hypothetical protein
VTENGELVHGHCSLILSVDTLVSDQACGCNHVCGHAVANEENNVLRLALLSEVLDEPLCFGLASIVIIQRSNILARLVKSNTTVGLCGNVDESCLLRVTCEEIFRIGLAWFFKVFVKLLTLVVGKVPFLNLRLLNLEVVLCSFPGSTLLRDSEGELLVQGQTNALGSVHGLMNLKTDIKVLSGQEIGPDGELVLSSNISGRALEAFLLQIFTHDGK